MTDTSRTIGVARCLDYLRAAQVENDGARIVVRSLEVFAADDAHEAREGRLFFNVPERMAILKAILARTGSPIEAADIVQFEMAQSLLDSPEMYYFDALPLCDRPGGRRYISVAYPRRAVDLLIADYHRQMRRPSGFKLNAVAMVDAYLKFCQPEPGDLQLLADLEADTVSLAIVYQRKLRAIGWLDIKLGDTITPGTARTLAVECKLVTGYYLNQLLDDGIGVPLSRVILSGQYADDALIQTSLSDQMAAEIILPPFNPGYFQLENQDEMPSHLEKFMIPLGLAVE